MDERSINGAAIRAIHDLELDCEIKDVCQSSGRDEWCIQFSGKYGQFCDDFRNQFGKENSSQVIREKIKSHLLKQVSKIRSSTGRRRKPAVNDATESRDAGSDLLNAPLQFVKEAFNRATGIAGEVINQASNVAETARDVVADVATNISPVTIEVRSTTREVKKRTSSSSRRKTVKAAKKAASKTVKAAGRVTKRVSKQAKKASVSARKRATHAQKTSRKTARKVFKKR
jgi:hypothetical protein